MKYEITFLKGNKKINDTMRKLDFYQEEEGVFVKETITATTKSKRLGKAKIRAILKGLTKIYEESGFEIMDMEFKIVVS